jgi:hypothetical protein
MSKIREHFSILGKKVEDLVTGRAGVATGISFDLYGCVQVVLNPGLDKEDKPHETHWYDIARLRVVDDVTVMDPPDFFGDSAAAAGEKGPAEKPSMAGRV